MPYLATLAKVKLNSCQKCLRNPANKQTNQPTNGDEGKRISLVEVNIQHESTHAKTLEEYFLDSEPGSNQDQQPDQVGAYFSCLVTEHCTDILRGHTNLNVHTLSQLTLAENLAEDTVKTKQESNKSLYLRYISKRSMTNTIIIFGQMFVCL